jgi:CBS domain containing-hemolysin-like protein
VRRRAALPEAEPAADEAKLLGRLLDATAEADAGNEVDSTAVRHLLSRVLHLRETPVTAIMRPRAAIVWVGLRDRVPVAVERMRAAGHSRLPVCGRDLDDVVGIVHLKDVFLAEQGVAAATVLSAIAREPSLVGAEASLATLLAEWRHGNGTLSLVRAASGEIVGLVTLADVIGWLLAAPEPAAEAQGGESTGAGA